VEKDVRLRKMSATGKLGLTEFKNKTKKQKTLFDEKRDCNKDSNKDSNKAENMATTIAIKDKINYILTWLSENEERIEELEAKISEFKKG
jgi:hypothetical protein